MSLRCLYLIDKDGDVMLQKKFPTVERRHKRNIKDDNEYHPIPEENCEMTALFRRNVLDNIFIESSIDYPILYFTDEDDNILWPIILLYTLDIYLVAIPDIPISEKIEESNALELPCFTAAILFLQDVAKFLLSYSPVFSNENLNELQCYLTTMIPFGTPMESNPKVIKGIHHNNLSNDIQHPTKKPSWKPVTYTGRSEIIEINLIEHVTGVLYGRGKSISDVWSASGYIKCVADVQGVPDITLSLSNTDNLSSVSVHECAQPISEAVCHKIIFSPPLGNFTLCNYMVNTVSEKFIPPLYSKYEMMDFGNNLIHIDFKLSLQNILKSKATIKDLSINIPLKNRNTIAKHNLATSSGSININKDRNFIELTNIKFGSNSDFSVYGVVLFMKEDGKNDDCDISKIDEREISMMRTECYSKNVRMVSEEKILLESCVNASKKEVLSPHISSTSYSDDPFFFGLNSFVQIRFNIPAFTLSGLNVDHGAVVVHSHDNSRPSVSISKNVFSVDVTVWNTFGDSKRV